MESAYIKPQMQQQQHRRGQIMRYNSVDNRLLASLYDPTANMYTNTNLLVIPSHYQQSHKMVQLQPQPQPPLLPFPTTATRPQHYSMSLPLRTTSSGKLNRATRKPKSQDHSAGKSKSNYQKIKEAGSASCVKEQLVSKIMTRSGSTTDYVCKKLDDFSLEQDQRMVSDLVFALSPHPSNLPLPKFFMRQRGAKLSCKAEEAKAGGSSTEGLRRVLQLQ